MSSRHLQGMSSRRLEDVLKTNKCLLGRMILVNLQKNWLKFDALDHNVLLDKVKCINFPDKIIQWFYSYLTNRAFFVSLNNLLSKAETINCEVPERSILGPLLLLLYKMIFHKVCQIVTHNRMRTTLALCANGLLIKTVNSFWWR